MKQIKICYTLIAFSVGILFFGCGRMPPPEFWTASPEDSAAVRKIITDGRWLDSLKFFFGDSARNSPILAWSKATDSTFREALKFTRIKRHYFPKEFNRVITSYSVSDSIGATKDTTITVRYKVKIEGSVFVRFDSATRYIKDTVIGEFTYPLFSETLYSMDSLKKIDTLYPFDTLMELSLRGSGEWYMFFDKDTSGDWQLMKRSGGTRFYIPDEEGAPYLGIVRLTGDTRTDTIVLRPDTLHYGIQRLYPLDSIPTFAKNETIKVLLKREILLGHYFWDPVDVFAFLHYKDTLGLRRADLIDGTAVPIAFTKTGLYQIFVEIVPRPVLTEKKTKYEATVWGIPIRIK